MIGKKSDKKQYLRGFFLLSFLSLFLQWYVFDFILPTKLLTPWLLYFSLLFVMRPIHSALLVFLVESLFLRIHLMKMQYTNTPFEASDIFSWRQAFFVKSYTDFVIPLIALGILYYLWKGLTLGKRQLLFLPVFLLVTTSCVQERNPTGGSHNFIAYLFRLARVQNVDWNLATNIKENGVLNHLFLTLSMGQIPSKGKLPYTEDGEARLAPDDAPDVFLVLCESCYTSSTDSFVTPMTLLGEEGYERTSIISPVYGGMTAEAEFEVLTGLPSRRYKGVDFQYFADRYSSQAMGLPRFFERSGYDTFSIHTNKAFFWSRDVVHPKFGFERSYFLEDMNWPDESVIPEDSVLFEHSLKAYKENLDAGKKTFAFLITIYTHGPFKETNGDGGEAVYREKLEKSIRQFIEFQSQVLKMAKARQRPVVFLIFGDHKPAMTISFYRRHIFNDDYFEAKGASSDSFRFGSLDDSQKVIFGRVPLYIKSVGVNNAKLAGMMANDLREKPMYCLPAVLAEGVAVKSSYYDYLRTVCRKSPEQLVDGDTIQSSFAEAVYENLLFR